MHVFYLNRKFIYLALVLLISIYILLFYALSLKVAFTKYAENNMYKEAGIYNPWLYLLWYEDSSLDQSKIHIYGALELYLDFINIFLRLLSLFGRRR